MAVADASVESLAPSEDVVDLLTAYGKEVTDRVIRELARENAALPGSLSEGPRGIAAFCLIGVRRLERPLERRGAGLTDVDRIALECRGPKTVEERNPRRGAQRRRVSQRRTVEVLEESRPCVHLRPGNQLDVKEVN